MCPGPAHINRKIALLCEDDDIEIENCLALATSKILGTKVASVRFFIGEDEETSTASHIDDKLFDSNINLPNEEEEPKSQYYNELIITPEQTNNFKNCQQKTTTNEPDCKGVLKSPNSPTFGEKKSVRFADSVGLELEEIKLYKRDGDSSEFDSDYKRPPVYQTRQDIFYGTTENRRLWNPFLQRSAA